MNSKIYKTLTIILILVVAGFLAFEICFTQIPVLNKTVSAESEITLNDVKMSSIPVWDVKEETVKEYSEIVGKVAIIDLPANTALPLISFKEKPVSNNETIDTDSLITFSLVVDSKNIPSDVAVGDLINFIVFFQTEIKDGNVTISDYAIGVSELATVKAIKAEGASVKLDVFVSKNVATDLTVLVEKGTIHVIKNEEFNSIGLEGAVMKDLYTKYNTTGNLIEIEDEIPEIEIEE